MKTADDQKRAVRARYNYEVRRYESSRFGSPGGRFFDKVEKKYATRFLASGRVLHVGTATGRFTRYLSEQGYQYVGIEISDGMISATKEKVRNELIDADIVQGDAECLPFRASCFNNILSVRSFHFLPQVDRFLKSARCLLRPGGRIIVSFETHVPYLRGIVVQLRLLPMPLPPRTFHTIRAVEQQLKENGFRIVWAGKATKLPLLVYWRMPPLFLPVLQRVHDKLPQTFGTVGLVVGEKPRTEDYSLAESGDSG